MEELISCALFLDEQIIKIKNSESDICSLNNSIEAKNNEIPMLLATAVSLNKIILSRKKNVRIDFGRTVFPEYNLENLGLSAETIKFLRQKQTNYTY